jgi:hypothetical protein
MRPIASIVIVVVAAGSVLALAQDGVRIGATGTVSEAQSWQVRLTEFRSEAGAAPDVAAEEILRRFEQSRREGAIDPINTVRLSVMEGREARAQFGRIVSVTTGTVAAGNEVQARQERREIGTLTQLHATGQGSEVLLRISYESSRLAGQEGAGPGEIVSIRIDSTVLLAPGGAALVGGAAGDPSSYLLVSIEP